MARFQLDGVAAGIAAGRGTRIEEDTGRYLPVVVGGVLFAGLAVGASVRWWVVCGHRWWSIETVGGQYERMAGVPVDITVVAGYRAPRERHPGESAVIP